MSTLLPLLIAFSSFILGVLVGALHHKKLLKQEQACTLNENWKPLYTHPAPSWQKLSDNEIARLVIINEVDKSGDTGFSKLIEQALKEKNGGGDATT